MNTSIDYFSNESARHDLKGKAVRGGIYTAVAQAIIVLVGLAAFPILARLLAPADFGLVAMVTVFTGFAAMFVDAGMSMATVQRESINHQQVSNLFWLAAGLGLAIAGIVAALSPAIAWFYSEPRLVPITLALCASFVFSGLTIQHQALLRRAMQFKALAAVHVLSSVIAHVLAVFLAWQYRSYWALVVLPVAAAALRMAATWWACNWRPALPRRGAGVRAMVGFGANLTGFSLINYFARNADNMLIGWWSGAVPLGFYERAYRLMMAPLTQINMPLAGVMIPALSRLQDQPAKYRRAFLRAVSVLQIVSCPLMAFVAVTAPWIVRLVFGPGWEEATPILRWLAVAGFVQPLVNALGWLYISQGRGRDMMRWGVVGCSLIVVSFAAGLPWGPVGVACAYALVVYLVIVPLAYWLAGCKGPVTTADLWRLTGFALLFALPTVLASAIVAYCFPHLTSLEGVVLSGFASALASALALACTKSGRTLVYESVAQIQNAVRQPRKL